MNIDVAIVKDFFFFEIQLKFCTNIHIFTFTHSPRLVCENLAHLFFSSSLFWASNCRFQAGTADSFLSFKNSVKTTIFKTLAVNIKVI